MSHIDTVCPRDCYDTCSMSVSIRDNELVRTIGDKNNPVTQGFLCPRGYRDIERMYSSERILYPHKRVGDEFERISWDDALSLLIEKLKDVLDTYGSQSCLQLDCIGNMGLFSSQMPQRLFYALGFTQTDRSICSKSGHDALSLHYGLTYGIDPEELSDMELTVYWGFNAAVSAPHFHRLSVKAQKKGGSIVVIDPRDTETAQSADFCIQLAPGSDVALAYGVLKYVIDNDLVDYAFIDEYTYGFDKLKEEVSTWKEDDIKKYTGVAWSTIVKLADLYTKNRNVTMIGIGMQKSLYGAEAVRAISLIPAVLGIDRGFYYSNCQGFYVDMAYVTGEKVTDKPINVVSQVSLGDYLLTGKCKLVYIHNANPAATLPHQKAVAKGLQHEDTFVVVHDTHWTETAKTADLVLPAPTFLEKEDVVISYSHKYVRKSNKVIEPLGESKSELWVTTQLAKQLQCNGWVAEDAWNVIEKAFQGACDTGTIQDLKRGGMITLKMRPKNEYQTPTKRIELYATKAEPMGVTPLPKQYALPENGFIFLNSATKKYTHTQFQDVHGLIPPIVFINIKDAVTHNIQDTDIVELYNELGSIKLKAVLSVSVPQNVLWAPRQGRDIEGTPQNVIIPGTTQKIGGGPVVNSTVVKIRKSQEK